jgi:ubiquinone/menaquinone biosynthesis C-methylase UbiE
MNAKDFVKKSAVQGLTQARAVLYTLESLPLPILHRWIAGGESRTPSQEQQGHIIREARRLLAVDAQDFVDLELPINLLAPEPARQHVPRWLQILGDSTMSFWRRRHQDTQSFSTEAGDLSQYPEYYRRNFHHQTDGYLTKRSSEIYEHQVELLFRGLANPMRRRLLKPMSRRLAKKKHPRILELGCGNGTFTKQLVAAFPEARITAVDLSPAYIQHAKERFIQHRNVDFILGDAESLPFKANTFDAVVSVFLHHELPRPVRENVLQESLRLCKKSGFWGLVDSLQLGDDPVLDWAIEDFPKNFHEPFFTNYIKTPLFDFVKTADPKRSFKEKNYLLSKVLYSD